jgi:hypothetical protein
MGFLSKLFGGSSGGVKYVKTYTEQKMGATGPISCTYEMHKAKTAQEAREYLETKDVTKRLYYVVVETPEGNWAKDIDGMYKEK